MSQSLDILNVFNTITLRQIFWKTETVFKKLEYRILVESTNIENAIFPYKTPVPEAYRVGGTKWTYHKEQSFARNYFVSSKILSQFKNVA